MIRLAGHGSSKVAAHLAIGQDGVIEFQVEGGSMSISAVSQYQHMGVLQHVTGSLTPEIKHRVGAMFEEYRKIRGPVLANQGLQMSVRLSFEQSLLESKLFYNAALWARLSKADWGRLSKAYMTAVRAAVGQQCRRGQQNMSDVKVLQLAGKHHVRVQVTSGGEWTSMLASALEAIWQVSPGLRSSMPDPKLDLQEWIRAIAGDLRTWRGVLLSGRTWLK
eukprot:13432303-Alexandrium_andersonii.AAC.1